MTSVGPDLSEFTAANSGATAQCSVKAVLASLDADRAARLIAALDAPPHVIQHMAIERTLAKWNVRLLAATIARHRAGSCTCGR